MSSFASGKRLLIIFVTGNANKRREVQQIMGSSHYEVISREIDGLELQGMPDDISKDKCRHAIRELQDTVLPEGHTRDGTYVVVEDTCLCFHALKGLPGPYVKWFLEKLGHRGLINMLAAYEDKSAYALCSLGYGRLSDVEGRNVKVIQGSTQGHIVEPRQQGDGPAFGWDPVFEPTEEEQGKEGPMQTYAEMESRRKNAMSHRFRAFDKFRDELANVQQQQQQQQQQK